MKAMLADERGISEEFTSLPALMVVMIGFALFFALIAGVYYTHQQKVDDKELYEAAHHALMKLTLPESPLISEGGSDTPLIVDADIGSITKQNLMECCNLTGYNYQVKIHYFDGENERQLDRSPLGDSPNGDRVSVSRKIAVKFTEGDVKHGKLVVVTWEI